MATARSSRALLRPRLRRASLDLDLSASLEVPTHYGRVITRPWSDASLPSRSTLAELSPRRRGRRRLLGLETKEEQRAFLIDLGSKLGFEDNQLELWYKISYRDLVKNGGRALLALHGNSPSRMLAELFPNHAWDPSKFSKRPKGFWVSMENQRRLLTDLGSKLGLTGDMEGWYGVSRDELVEVGGSAILEYYGSSISKMLLAVFPEIKWDKSRLGNKSKEFWEDPKNRKAYLEDLGKRLGFDSLEAWYRLTSRNLIAHGGLGLLNLYKKSIYRLISEAFPEHEWDQGRFVKRRVIPLGHNPKSAKSPKPAGYWEDPSNQRAFLVALGKSLGIEEGITEPWYKISMATIAKHGGSALFRSRYRSTRDLLRSVFPEVEWDPSKFPRRARNHWNNLENQRDFMVILGKTLRFADMSAWYSIRVEDLAKNGGWRLLERYGGSPANLVQTVFHEHNWDRTKFMSHKLAGKGLDRESLLRQEVLL